MSSWQPGASPLPAPFNWNERRGGECGTYLLIKRLKTLVLWVTQKREVAARLRISTTNMAELSFTWLRDRSHIAPQSIARIRTKVGFIDFKNVLFSTYVLILNLKRWHTLVCIWIGVAGERSEVRSSGITMVRQSLTAGFYDHRGPSFLDSGVYNATQ